MQSLIEFDPSCIAGIIGSSIALNLTKKGCKVTLLDSASHAASAASGESWAWLNANRKAPEHYRGNTRRTYNLRLMPCCTCVGTLHLPGILNKLRTDIIPFS